MARDPVRLPDTIRMSFDPVTDVPAVPPNKSWRNNPDGDGEAILSLKNTGSEPVTLPVYGSNPADWLLISVGESIHTLRGQSESLPPATVLKPGEKVEFRVNFFAIDGEAVWPNGGYRVPIRAILGGQVAVIDFYYYTSHHEPIRKALM